MMIMIRCAVRQLALLQIDQTEPPSLFGFPSSCPHCYHHHRTRNQHHSCCHEIVVSTTTIKSPSLFGFPSTCWQLHHHYHQSSSRFHHHQHHSYQSKSQYSLWWIRFNIVPEATNLSNSIPDFITIKKAQNLCMDDSWKSFIRNPISFFDKPLKRNCSRVEGDMRAS